MFNQYPYLNINDLNLDFILKAIREMKYEVTNFVSINAIKYADPIQWNITSQYEKNTIVIDPVTGTAYISVAPVPAGVSLTRPEYWTVVFDLGSFVTRAAQNFTNHWESDTTTTATFPTTTGGWLVWGDVLYKALTNITAGDAYVVGSNIEHFTIEDLYNTYLNTIASILAIIGDLTDLNTADKSSVVNAINDALNIAITNCNLIRYNISPYTEVVDPDTGLVKIAIPNYSLFWLPSHNLAYAVVDIAIGDTLQDGVNYYPCTIYSLLMNIFTVNNLTIRGSMSVGGDVAVSGKIISPLNIGSLVDVESIINGLLTKISHTNAADYSRILTVGATGCNYTTINDAITAARAYCTPSNRVLIWIMPGVYNEQIKLIPNPGIDFVGFGAIIEGAYSYPEAPLYAIGKGVYVGLEFSNTISPSDSNAYAFHCDAQDLGTLGDEQGYMNFINCRFISRSHGGVGIGLGSGQYVNFESCWIQNSEDNGYTGAYMHNYPSGDVSYSYIRFNNCEINATSNVEDVQIFDEGGYNNHTAPFVVQFINCATRHRRGRFGKGLNGTQYTNAHDLAANASNFMYYPESNIDPYGGTPFAFLDSSKFALQGVAPTINANNVDALYIDVPFDANAYNYVVSLFELEPIIADTTDPDYVAPTFNSYTLNVISSRTIQVVFTGLVNTRAIHYNIASTIK